MTSNMMIKFWLVSVASSSYAFSRRGFQLLHIFSW